MAIKAQALTDFIVEFTHDVAPKTKPRYDITRWKLFVDESSNQHDCGAGLILQILLDEQMEYVICIG